MSFAAARKKVQQREQGVFARLRERQSNGKPAAGQGMAALRARRAVTEAQQQLALAQKRYDETFAAEEQAFRAFDKVDIDPRKRHSMKWLRLHDDWVVACRRQDNAYATLHNTIAMARRAHNEHQSA